MSPAVSAVYVSWPLGGLCGWLLVVPLVLAMGLARRISRNRRPD